ncbi:O-acetyl-ADP-ribose deacetylase [Methyloligella solikamskensis]|uniref:O-acetyl-ADP-ribose deacetylase n=1 Tax=Methyloligella solikamskensis TaxID=1177756 RepID=A0ABW3J6C5_9HYPH
MKNMEIVQGDITRLDVDAIVNAANAQLAPGGGVCGAIHRAAGPELAEACAEIGSCPTGEARITPGFDLKARHVIHAVGPVWHGGDSGEDEALAACYRNSIALADEHGLTSIAFPAISTGIYGFPPDRAAAIAVQAAGEALAEHPKVETVIFCCFDDVSAKRHEEALTAWRKRQ